MDTPELIAAFRAETEDLIHAVLLQYYFNNGLVPYANTTEVLSVIPVGLRAAYLTVNVAGVEYWFLPDGSLVNKTGSLTLIDKSVTMAKIMDIATQTFIGRNTAGTGSPEVLSVATVLTMLGLNGYGDKVDKDGDKTLIDPALILKIHDKFAADEAAVIQSILDFLDALVLTENNYTDEEKAKLALLHQDIYTVNLPTGDVSERAAGAVGGPGVVDWTFVAAANPNDLQITHNLNREIAGVNVFYLDGTERTQLMGNLGHTGLSGNLNVITVKGLSTKAFPLIIHLIFS